MGAPLFVWQAAKNDVAGNDCLLGNDNYEALRVARSFKSSLSLAFYNFLLVSVRFLLSLLEVLVAEKKKQTSGN